MPALDSILISCFSLGGSEHIRLNAGRGIMKVFVAGLFVWIALFQAGAWPAADFVTDGTRLSGAVFDLYSGNEAEPAVVIRLDKAYTDYQSKGFFRIGLLPIGVIEGVTFRLQHPDSAANCLALIHHWLAGATANAAGVAPDQLPGLAAGSQIPGDGPRPGGRQRQTGIVRRRQVCGRDQSSAGCSRRAADHRRPGWAACLGNHPALDHTVSSATSKLPNH